MTNQSVLETLREHRIARHLKQTDLASLLGIRQSQVSNLERATVDPRLSTVQDIARVLDLELVLVPRQLISVVDGLVRRNDLSVDNDRPLYRLEGDNSHDDAEVR